MEIKAYLTCIAPGGKGPSFVTAHVNNIKWSAEGKVYRRCFPPVTGSWPIKARPTNHLCEKSRKQPKQKVQFFHLHSHPFIANTPCLLCSRTTLLPMAGALLTWYSLKCLPFPQQPVLLQLPTYPQLPISQVFYSQPQTPMPRACLEPLRNASISPWIYKLIITPSVTKCYGYGSELNKKHKSPLSNIIKQVDKRLTWNSTVKHLLSSFSKSYKKESTFFRPSLSKKSKDFLEFPKKAHVEEKKERNWQESVVKSGYSSKTVTRFEWSHVCTCTSVQ